MTVLVGERIVTGDGGISASPAWVVVDGDRIVAVGSGAPPAGADVVEHRDCLLAPGFIDLQINGAGATDFAHASVAEIVATLAELATDGCTTVVPTVVSAPLGAYEPMLVRLAKVRTRVPGVLGVHLEGPFLGGAPGAHPPELVRTADVDWLLRLLDRFPGLVRIVTLAPEADPDLALTRALASRGVVVSLGHSNATYAQACESADAGATMVTHLFNGMGPLRHREPGLPGAALDDRRLVPSFIADLVHVHPAAIRLALAARPDAVLVSDRVGGAFAVRDGAARLADGTLAGSVVTMLDSVRNLVRARIPVGQAVRTATGNPARALGLTDRGRVAPGCRADLLWLDPVTLAVRARWPDDGRGGGRHGS
jgi:N-acetylglucosamine-6-phosphate deacetylase